MALNPIFTQEEEKKKLQQTADVNQQAAQQAGGVTQQTWSNTGSTQPAAAPQAAASSYDQYKYDASLDTAYQQALAALQNAQKQKPTYAATYDDELNALYDQIVNRDKFQYDINSDMLYQNAKNQYIMQGQMAMRDTIGQAAALTGGYGNTYGQMVGQQAYDAHLQNLNEQIPDFYNMALQQYIAEGDQMNQQYAMLGDLRNQEYGMYQDELSEYWRNVDLLRDEANTAYDRGRDNWLTSVQLGREQEQLEYDRQWAEEERDYNRQQDAYNKQWAEEERDYNRQQDAYNKQWAEEERDYNRQQDAYNKQWAEEEREYDRQNDQLDREWAENESAYDRQNDQYDRLVSLITSTGYTPTTEELTAAGMSEAQAKSYLDYYKQQNSGGSSGSSGSGSSSSGGSSSNKTTSKTPTKESEKTTSTPAAFTGASKNQAIAYLEKYGAPTDDIMDQQMWEQQKIQYQNSGTGSYEVKNYSTYNEYLNAVVNRNMSYR